MATASINGTELFYVTAGEGLPCLVMHGGLGFDHTYLHPWLDPLGDTLKLIYYDHRGNGRSGRPSKDTMTHAQFAADAEALALHLGHDKVAVIGHSYGGFIGLEFALRHPHRVSHLILLDTAPAFNYTEEIMENARRMGATEEMMEVLQEDWSTDEEMRRRYPLIWPLYFKNFDPDIAQRLVEKCIITASGGAREGELPAYNAVPRLGEIHIPSLILVGGIVWGFGAELSQHYVPQRGASLFDLGANILGVLIGLAAYRLLTAVLRYGVGSRGMS
jgi:proline iminopeptidase